MYISLSIYIYIYVYTHTYTYSKSFARSPLHLFLQTGPVRPLIGCEGGSSLGKPQLNEGQGGAQLLLLAVTVLSERPEPGTESKPIRSFHHLERKFVGGGRPAVVASQQRGTLPCPIGSTLAGRHAKAVPESGYVDARPTKNMFKGLFTVLPIPGLWVLQSSGPSEAVLLPLPLATSPIPELCPCPLVSFRSLSSHIPSFPLESPPPSVGSPVSSRRSFGRGV